MREAGGSYNPLPVDQSLAYILEVLPAFQYLHDLGLVYCDFKPDNLIQIGDAVKLIDLGGVRRLDDDESAIYGTVGYQAPEVPQVGTSVASDIYTIGRTLLVLMAEFRGYQTTYVERLPPVEDVPAFIAHDSLYRLVAKMCAPDPADRFASVDELRVQLLGVLREVVAEKQAGTALTSAASVLFEAPAVVSDALAWDQLPALRVDTTDGQFSWLSNITADDPKERLGRAQAGAGHHPRGPAGPGPGRAAGRLGQDRARGRQPDAHPRPVGVASGLDERAARPAAQGRQGRAVGLQRRVRAGARRAGPQAGAGPGLRARWRAGSGGAALPDLRVDRRELRRPGRLRAGPGALGTQGRRRGRCRRWIWSRPRRATTPSRSDRRPSCCTRRPTGCRCWRRRWTASRGCGWIRWRSAELSAKILERALATVQAKGPNRRLTIGGIPADDPDLRDGLEATYRTLASAADDDQERYALVDKANEVRRWTLT